MPALGRVAAAVSPSAPPGSAHAAAVPTWRARRAGAGPFETAPHGGGADAVRRRRLLPRRPWPASPPGRGCGAAQRRRSRGDTAHRIAHHHYPVPEVHGLDGEPHDPEVQRHPGGHDGRDPERPQGGIEGGAGERRHAVARGARRDRRRSGPSSGTSSTAGVPSTRCSGRRSMAEMSGALAGEPRRSDRNPAVQCTTGTPAARAAASRRAVLAITPASRRGRGELGEARQVAHHAPLDLHGEHGGPAPADELGERDGHAQRVTRAGSTHR